MSRYTSKHTGPKIDEAVDRANGYGLGGGATKKINNFNDAVNNGWYLLAGTTSNGPFENAYGWMLVSSRSGSGGMIRQDFWQSIANPIHYVRYAVNGEFTAWEYVNPPMKLGVEYRTTERHLEKPVYVKLVDLGNCPSSSYKDVSVLGNTEVGFRCEGKWTYGGGSTLPFESSSNDRMAIAIIDKKVRIFTGGKDFSTYTAKATIYYTKTTD